MHQGKKKIGEKFLIYFSDKQKLLFILKPLKLTKLHSNNSKILNGKNFETGNTNHISSKNELKIAINLPVFISIK